MRILYRYPTAEPFVCDGFYSGVMTAGYSSDGGGAYGYVSPGGFGSILPNLEDWAIIYSVPAGALVVQDSSGFYPTSIAIDGTVYNLTSGMSDPISNPFIEGNTYDICLINEACFGYLYNWYTIDDSRELTSSADWSVPTSAQMSGLISYVTNGGRLKSTVPFYWDENQYGAENLYGFDMRGGGQRSMAGVFNGILESANLWSSSNGQFSGKRVIAFVTASITTTLTDRTETSGNFIRLVKDSTGIPDGTTTTYTGNDGKIYNAVCINELYWTTENLEETQYRNGDLIPNVEDNTTWANLTTGALCLYDNDANNACKTPLPNYDINYVLTTISTFSFVSANTLEDINGGAYYQEYETGAHYDSKGVYNSVYDRWVMTGDFADGIVYSDNGVEWTAATTSTVSKAIATNGAIWTTGKEYSTDGITWNATSNGSSWVFGHIIWDGVQFVAIENATSPEVLTSTDGSTWTVTGTSFGANGSQIAGSASDNIYVTAQSNGGYTMRYSTDLITWNLISTRFSTNGTAVDYNGSMFVAVGNNGGTNALQYSSDGINWTQVDIPLSYGRDVKWDSNRWIVLGNPKVAGESSIFTSTDGITWTAIGNDNAVSQSDNFYIVVK